MSNPYATFNDGVIEQFRANGGRVRNFGDALILIHHVGAKSAVERIAPVMALRDGDAWLVAGSKAGAPEHPAWYHNLLAHPDVTIETPEGDVEVHAEKLHGARRDAAWERFTTASSGFAAYQDKTDRVIPVVKLSPR